MTVGQLRRGVYLAVSAFQPTTARAVLSAIGTGLADLGNGREARSWIRACLARLEQDGRIRREKRRWVTT